MREILFIISFMIIVYTKASGVRKVQQLGSLVMLRWFLLLHGVEV